MDSAGDEKHPGGSKIEELSAKNGTKLVSQSSSDDNDQILSSLDSNSDSDSEFVCNVCNKRFSGYKPFIQHEKSRKHAKAIVKKKRAKKLLEKIAAAENDSDNEGEYLFCIKKQFAVCQTCNKEFGGPESYQMHLVSKAHKQKVLQASILDQVKDNGEINTDMLREFFKNKQDGDQEYLVKDTKEKIDLLKQRDNEESGESEALECKDCQKIFTGFIPYTQHILSKVHTKAVEKKKLLGQLTHKGEKYSAEPRYRDVSSLEMEDGVLTCKLCSTAFNGPESAVLHLKSKGHSKNLDKFSRKVQKKLSYKKSLVAMSGIDTPAEDDPKGKPESESSATSEDESDSSSASDSSEVKQSNEPTGKSADCVDRPSASQEIENEKKNLVSLKSEPLTISEDESDSSSVSDSSEVKQNGEPTSESADCVEVVHSSASLEIKDPVKVTGKPDAKTVTISEHKSNSSN